jgi:hypothetical protein
VVARQKADDEARAIQRKKDEAIAAEIRLEASKRIAERKQTEAEQKRRTELSNARRAMDPALNSAIRSIEWGFYVSGIERLHVLSAAGNVDAKDYLDPDMSPIAPKLYVGMYYIGQHHAANADPAAGNSIFLLYFIFIFEFIKRFFFI